MWLLVCAGNGRNHHSDGEREIVVAELRERCTQMGAELRKKEALNSALRMNLRQMSGRMREVRRQAAAQLADQQQRFRQVIQLSLRTDSESESSRNPSPRTVPAVSP